MNNWKEFAKEWPTDGQLISMGRRLDDGLWVSSAPCYWPRGKGLNTHWMDMTPPPMPSKMEQAWEALQDSANGDPLVKKSPSGADVFRPDFEFGWQQCEKAYGLKKGGEAK